MPAQISNGDDADYKIQFDIMEQGVNCSLFPGFIVFPSILILLSMI